MKEDDKAPNKSLGQEPEDIIVYDASEIGIDAVECMYGSPIPDFDDEVTVLDSEDVDEPQIFKLEGPIPECVLFDNNDDMYGGPFPDFDLITNIGNEIKGFTIDDFISDLMVTDYDPKDNEKDSDKDDEDIVIPDFDDQY